MKSDKKKSSIFLPVCILLGLGLLLVKSIAEEVIDTQDYKDQRDYVLHHSKFTNNPRATYDCCEHTLEELEQLRLEDDSPHYGWFVPSDQHLEWFRQNCSTEYSDLSTWLELPALEVFIPMPTDPGSTPLYEQLKHNGVLLSGYKPDPDEDDFNPNGLLLIFQYNETELTCRVEEWSPDYGWEETDYLSSDLPAGQNLYLELSFIKQTVNDYKKLVFDVISTDKY